MLIIFVWTWFCLETLYVMEIISVSCCWIGGVYLDCCIAYVVEFLRGTSASSFMRGSEWRKRVIYVHAILCVSGFGLLDCCGGSGPVVWVLLTQSRLMQVGIWCVDGCGGQAFEGCWDWGVRDDVGSYVSDLGI